MNLLINEVEFDEDSDIISNRIHRMKKYNSDFFRLYYDTEFMEVIYRKYGINQKKLFKDVFGIQQICKLYSNRCWIWSFSNAEKTATVYCVMDSNGISWEYKLKSIFSEVIKIRQEIENRIWKHCIQ